MSGEKYASPARSKPWVSWETRSSTSVSETGRSVTHPAPSRLNISTNLMILGETLKTLIADMVKGRRSLASQWVADVTQVKSRAHVVGQAAQGPLPPRVTSVGSFPARHRQFIRALIALTSERSWSGSRPPPAAPQGGDGSWTTSCDS